MSDAAYFSPFSEPLAMDAQSVRKGFKEYQAQEETRSNENVKHHSSFLVHPARIVTGWIPMMVIKSRYVSGLCPDCAVNCEINFSVMSIRTKIIRRYSPRKLLTPSKKLFAFQFSTVFSFCSSPELYKILLLDYFSANANVKNINMRAFII